MCTDDSLLDYYLDRIVTLDLPDGSFYCRLLDYDEEFIQVNMAFCPPCIIPLRIVRGIEYAPAKAVTSWELNKCDESI